MLNKPISDVNLQLWISRVGERSLQIEQDIIPLLSPSEKQRLSTTTSVNKRREFLLSRAVMRHALSQQFDRPLSEWVFISRPKSAPVISNLPKNIFISLSHSNGFIIFATSLFPIGVDVELIKDKENIISLAKVVMTDDELRLIKNCTEQSQTESFYRTWCAKEAYYKAMPSEQQALTKLTSISIFEFIEKNKDWTLIEDKSNQFIFTLILNNKCIVINRLNHKLFM